MHKAGGKTNSEIPAIPESKHLSTACPWDAYGSLYCKEMRTKGLWPLELRQQSAHKQTHRNKRITNTGERKVQGKKSGPQLHFCHFIVRAVFPALLIAGILVSSRMKTLPSTRCNPLTALIQGTLWAGRWLPTVYSACIQRMQSTCTHGMIKE